MKISLLNNNFVNKNFKQTVIPTIDIGKLTGVNERVDQFVKEKFEERKQNTINNLSTLTYDRFTKTYNQKIDDVEKFNKPYQKALILQKLAHSYYENKNIEKAAIVLTQSLNTVDKNQKYLDKEIKNLIEAKINRNILEDFFYCSNNIKAKYFVMKSLNNLNEPYYLPIAEAVCNCDSEKVTLNDNKTIYEAKQFLNKHYNLDLIASYIENDSNTKIGALNLLSKWGLEKHQKIAKKLFEDEDDYVNKKAKNVFSCLKNTQNYNELDFETEPDRELLPQRTPKSRTALMELIKANEDNTSVIKYIKELGNIVTLPKEALTIKPKDSEEYSKPDEIKAEAFLKIIVRGNIKKDYLL